MTDNNRGPATGIALDAESLRAELREAPEAHGLDPEQAAEIAALPDGQINSWIHELAARDDAFWALYDGAPSPISPRCTAQPRT